MNQKNIYDSPQMSLIDVFFAQVVCAGSPQPGENEGVSYEDWGQF